MVFQFIIYSFFLRRRKNQKSQDQMPTARVRLISHRLAARTVWSKQPTQLPIYE